MPAKHYVGLGYAWIPAIGAAAWLSLLIALLGIWASEDEGNIVYISDVGAHKKSLFIALCVVTSVFFVAALALERWLRHQARLDPNLRRREKYLSIGSVLFAAGGCGCLIGLSIKDAFHHSTVHWRLTIGFIVCVAISCVFTTAEWGWLNTDYKSARMLRFSYAMKILIVILAIVAAIVLAAYYHDDNRQSTAAVCEWVVAFLFDFYIWTLVFDLYPAVHTKKSRDLSNHNKVLEKRHYDEEQMNFQA